MSPTDQIAKLLGVSHSQADSYCKEVRKLSGLGSRLHYQTIRNQLVQGKPPYPSASDLAKVIKVVTVNSPLVAAKAKKTSKPLAIQPAPNSCQVPALNVNARFTNKNSFFEADLKSVVAKDFYSQDLEFEQFAPSILPKNVERYSYQDYGRVPSETLEHCKHDVPLNQICAICNPREFRRMTGID